MRSDAICIDTNVLLYSLGGDKQITRFLQGKNLFASVMVRMEAMVYHGEKPDYLKEVREFLTLCEVVELTSEIQDAAVEIRIKHKLKLPDAVIAATAQSLSLPLVTADGRFERLRDEIKLLRLRKK
ncbi:MAG: type II toxin-antitoxin system VapC family toxin [Flavobacteriales bacterium]